jgi:hypothetical protein
MVSLAARRGGCNSIAQEHGGDLNEALLHKQAGLQDILALIASGHLTNMKKLSGFPAPECDQRAPPQPTAPHSGLEDEIDATLRNTEQTSFHNCSGSFWQPDRFLARSVFDVCAALGAPGIVMPEHPIPEMFRFMPALAG